MISEQMDIRDRAIHAYEEQRRRQKHAEALRAQEEAQRGAERLTEALRTVLGIELQAADPVVEIDGVRFRGIDWQYGLALSVIQACEDCGAELTNAVLNWAELGDVLSRPPLHRGCPAIPIKPAKPTVEERLVAALISLIQDVVEER